MSEQMTEVMTGVKRRRNLPNRLREAMAGLEGDALVLLRDALNEVERHRERTANEVGFTYALTGERVRLFSPDARSLEIIAEHPETLTMLRVGLSLRNGEGLSETPPDI